MLTLLSCAKTMRSVDFQSKFPASKPLFEETAKHSASLLATLSVEDLAEMLGVNSKIATENKLNYLNFSVEGLNILPAVLAYNGIAFKHLNPEDFTAEEAKFAQDHLFITSFLYGLLRPGDNIQPYRLEGKAVIPGNESNMFAFWKPKLTDVLIESVQKAGGILCNLASNEMKNLFDWKRVSKEVEIVTPEFKVAKNGKLVSSSVYAKMGRGEMTRFIIKNRLQSPDDLTAFTGLTNFAYDASISTPENPIFIL